MIALYNIAKKQRKESALIDHTEVYAQALTQKLRHDLDGVRWLNRKDRMMRYIIKWGKFGAYFYDNKTKKDLSLKDVYKLLNKDE